MSQILHPARVQDLVASPADPAFSTETYQTNLNHARHSKFLAGRLTLEMLWFLRAPLMLRPVFIAGCLFLFLASSAGAAGVNPVRKSAHAKVARTSQHTRHTAKPASRSARSKVSSATSKRTAKKATPRRSTRSTASARRTVKYPGRHLRRARYGRRHSKAHFVPLATVPISHRSPPIGFHRQRTSL